MFFNTGDSLFYFPDYVHAECVPLTPMVFSKNILGRPFGLDSMLFLTLNP